MEAPAQTYTTAALLIVNGTRGPNGSQRNGSVGGESVGGDTNGSVGGDARFDIADCGVCVEVSKLVTVLVVLIIQ